MAGTIETLKYALELLRIVSMESGLDGRNNEFKCWRERFLAYPSQWSPA